MNSSNPLWNFFRSVQLAIFTLLALALTSIIGTIVPQGRPFEYYVKEYGEATARLLHIFDIPEMYSSWWFLTLLVLLTVNLIVCSIDRFPLALSQMTLDQTSLTRDRLEKMSFTHVFDGGSSTIYATLATTLQNDGWHITTRKTSEGEITAAQKERWSRIGVYVVHSSILVIFAGAFIGSFFGYKGSVLIPETKATDTIYSSTTQAPIDLGFTVRCDHFEIEFYENTMPKDYRSRLTVLENGKEVLVKDIEVNHPLKYRGVTFYQSSYQGYQDFLITLTGSANRSETLIAPFQQEMTFAKEEVKIGVINAEALRDRVVRVKIWLQHGQNPPITLWLNPQEPTSLQAHGLASTLTVKQMYATGLQVAKDPGVWIVYLGFLLMLSGLYIAFFMSHRRIWLVHDADTSGSVLLAGTSNKNRVGFEKQFNELVASITAGGKKGE
ncbi:MAG: cytochrome c biogenesis protein ResB [Desulfopila sp.]